MSRAAFLRLSLALGALALITSCAEVPTAPTTMAPPTPPPGYWNGDGVPGSPKIIVSISEQRAYFYKGKNLVGESTVSTGKPGFGTPPGYYTVFWKDAEHVSSVFGDYVDDAGNVTKSNIDVRKDSKPPGSHYDGARMPFAMFFRGGYAMHQGYVPPYAASHGCIRLPKGMAEVFFNNAAPGTPVVVKQEAVMHVVTAPPQVPAPSTVAPPAPTLVRNAPVRPGPVSTPAPALTTIAPPPPNVVRSTAPAPVRLGPVRTTVPAPSPIPLRSPAPVLTRAPGPVRPGPVTTTVPAPAPVRSPAPVVSRAPGTFPYRSSSPAPLRTPPPNLVRSTAPPPVRPGPSPVRTTVPGPSPIPLRSPAPVLTKTQGPVRPQGPVRTTVPGPSPVPLRSPAPVLTKTQASVRPQGPVRTTGPGPSPVPLRTPAPALTQMPGPVRPSGPAPGPATVRPTPPPAPSKTRHHKRSRTSAHSPAPSPSPTPAR